MYSELLKNAIQNKRLSLTQVCFQLARRNICLDRSILSKMQNGKMKPARDEVNIALSEILSIDSVHFRLAAVREELSEELFKLIKES